MYPTGSRVKGENMNKANNSENKQKTAKNEKNKTSDCGSSRGTKNCK